MGKIINSVQPFTRLRQVFRGDGQDVLALCVYSALVGVLSLAVPLTVQMLVNTAAMGALKQQLVVLSATTFALVLLMGALRLLQLQISERFQRRLAARIALSLSYLLPRRVTRSMSGVYGSDYVNRFMEVFFVQKGAAELLLESTRVLFQIVVGVILLSLYHPFFLIVSVVLSVSCVLVIRMSASTGHSTSYGESDGKYLVLTWLETLAGQLNIFRYRSSQDLALSRSEEYLQEYLKFRTAHFSLLQGQKIFAFVLQALTFSIVLGIGGHLVSIGELSLGQLVAAELVLATIIYAVMNGTKQLENYYDLGASLEKLSQLMECEIQEGRPIAHDKVTQGFVLEVHNLQHEHGTALKKLINFSVTRGEHVAILMDSCTGKSTLADILVGDLRPTNGQVNLDELPINDLSREMREGVYLLRAPELIHGTVRENITLGDPSIEVSHIHLVLKKIGLSDAFLASSPAGLETVINREYPALSSTELIKLELARVMVREPKLVVVDDILDKIDVKTRSSLVAGFRSELKLATMIVLTSDRDLTKCFDRCIDLSAQSRSRDEH